MKKSSPSIYAKTPTVVARLDYVYYEQRKRQWSLSNPNATSAEFEHAMNCIARLCGM